MSEAVSPSDLDRYLFELNGYLVLKGTLNEAEVAACNADLDLLEDLKQGEWHGAVQCHRFSDTDGKNLQQIYEMPAFRPMINHPSWIEYMKTFVDGAGSFDHKHGPLFIEEARGIVWPHDPALREPNRVPDTPNPEQMFPGTTFEGKY